MELAKKKRSDDLFWNRLQIVTTGQVIVNASSLTEFRVATSYGVQMAKDNMVDAMAFESFCEFIATQG